MSASVLQMSGLIGLPISMLRKGYFGRVVDCIQNVLLNKVPSPLQYILQKKPSKINPKFYITKIVDETIYETIK